MEAAGRGDRCGPFAFPADRNDEFTPERELVELGGLWYVGDILLG